MVREDGTVKIIDFGFGKEVKRSTDFQKSISLNWWCQVPNEFSASRYDFCTEVYFVGKLFEQIVQNNEIASFKYLETLRKMCQPDPNKRLQSFAEVEKMIRSDQFPEIDFTEEELESYRAFADSLSRYISKIKAGCKYVHDLTVIKAQLADKYKSFMLEKTVPVPSEVVFCFMDAAHYFNSHAPIPVSVVRDFVRLLKSCPEEKSRIILANLQTKLDSIPRYTEKDEPADDVPF